jgi:hypothetical protein
MMIYKKKLFKEVKVMDACISAVSCNVIYLQRNISVNIFKKNNEFDDEIEFFKQKKQIMKTFIHSGDEEDTYYYDSWQELKIHVAWLGEYGY